MKRNKSNCFQVDYLLEKVSLRFTFLLYCCYELLLPTYGVADSDSSPSIHYHGYLWSVQIQPSDLFLLGRDSIRLIQLPYLQHMLLHISSHNSNNQKRRSNKHDGMLTHIKARQSVKAPLIQQPASASQAKTRRIFNWRKSIISLTAERYLWQWS